MDPGARRGRGGRVWLLTGLWQGRDLWARGLQRGLPGIGGAKGLLQTQVKPQSASGRYLADICEERFSAETISIF